jgi:hypothetical protein
MRPSSQGPHDRAPRGCSARQAFERTIVQPARSSISNFSISSADRSGAGGRRVIYSLTSYECDAHQMAGKNTTTTKAVKSSVIRNL